MNTRSLLSPLLIVLALGIGAPASAGSSDPLFLNMTADEAHRALMALMFSRNQQARGHPVTVFLNDRGVLVGSKTNAEKYREQQQIIADVLKKGGTVLICPMCMAHYGVAEADLLPGIKVGNPELTGEALFKDKTQTLTW
jgi:predicted peroxiredoxin